MTIKAPKKIIKVNGIMKLNPEYTKWKEMQCGNGDMKPCAQPAAQPEPEAQFAVTGM